MASIINNPVVGSLIKSSSVRTYGKGQTIVYPDNSNAYLYLIKSGAVAMENINRLGERKVLYIFGISTLFPMVSFMEKSVSSSWFYTTLTDTEVYVVPYEKLAAKMKAADDFTIYGALMRQILTEVHELLLQISDHKKTDSVEKLISLLLFLMDHHTKTTSNTWRVVRFPVTHQLLADMTGLTRETVSLTVKELASRKILRYQEKGKLELNVNNLRKQQHS